MESLPASGEVPMGTDTTEETVFIDHTLLVE